MSRTTTNIRTAILSTAAAGLLLCGVATTAASRHVMVAPGDLAWQPAPPVLPPGASIAVLDGDPSQNGNFVIRLKFPDGYRIAPHWHPTDENIVVIQGTFNLGVGDTADPTAVHVLPTGSFAKMPREVRHFAVARGETIVQVHGPGPFVVNYVNPADDPTKSTSAQK